MNNKKIKEYIFENNLDIEKIINDYAGYVYTIIKNSGYSFNNEDIEEISSDVFLTIWKNKEKC